MRNISIVVVLVTVLMLALVVESCAYQQIGVVRFLVKSTGHAQWQTVEFWNPNNEIGFLCFRAGDVLFAAADEIVCTPDDEGCTLTSKMGWQPVIVGCDALIKVRPKSKGTALIKTYCYMEGAKAAPAGTIYEYPLMHDAGARRLMIEMNAGNPLKACKWDCICATYTCWLDLVKETRGAATCEAAFMSGNVFNFREIQQGIWDHVEAGPTEVVVYRGRRYRGHMKECFPCKDPWWPKGCCQDP